MKTSDIYWLASIILFSHGLDTNISNLFGWITLGISILFTFYYERNK